MALYPSCFLCGSAASFSKSKRVSQVALRGLNGYNHVVNSKAEEETLPHCPELLSPVVVLRAAAALYIQKLIDPELVK